MASRLPLACVALLAGLWRPPAASAQAFDCEDVDHDCDPGDKTIARGKGRGGRRGVDPIAPPLTGTCAGDAAPAAGADCVCNAADALSNRMLLKPPTCIQQPPAPCSVGTVASAPRPNFVIILTDDQRWDTVDATHQSPNRPGYVMPNVNRELTDSGVTFTEGY